jgi:hypothetical protein
MERDCLHLHVAFTSQKEAVCVPIHAPIIQEIFNVNHLGQESEKSYISMLTVLSYLCWGLMSLHL